LSGAESEVSYSYDDSEHKSKSHTVDNAKPSASKSDILELPEASVHNQYPPGFSSADDLDGDGIIDPLES